MIELSDDAFGFVDVVDVADDDDDERAELLDDATAGVRVGD